MYTYIHMCIYIYIERESRRSDEREIGSLGGWRSETSDAVNNLDNT